MKNMMLSEKPKKEKELGQKLRLRKRANEREINEILE